MKLTDTILAPRRGDPERALAYLDRPDAKDADYVNGLWHWCGVAGVDFAIAYAWFLVETADATSTRWNRDLNPGGIGIPSDSAVQPFAIPGGGPAARIHVQCLYSIVTGRRHPDVLLWAEAEPWFERVWLPKVNDPRFPPVTRLTDLDVRYTASDGEPHATWAWGFEEGQPAQAAVNKSRMVWSNLPDQQEEPMAEIVFGNVERPNIIDMIVPKPYEGAGFTRVPDRRCFGVCDHITDGDASLEWYAAFFGTGGQRQYDALTDFGIDKQGRIAMWNDPFGTRSPWASGGSDGLEGDGPLFVRTLGIGGINGAIASKEHVGRSPAKMTDAQLEASARLTAWIFDGASNHTRGSKVPWSSFPLNPNVGCVTHMQHWEFATKPCPGPGIRGQTDALQNRIRALMKQAQEGESQGEIPPPEPVEPDHDHLPPGIDWNIVADRFGIGELHRAGEEPGHFKFHRGRAWAEAYIARASEQKEWPAVLVWNEYEDAPGRTRDIITFANGWLLVRLNAREGWKWA